MMLKLGVIGTVTTCLSLRSVSLTAANLMPFGFLEAWLLQSILLHFDNRNLALFEMSDSQIRLITFLKNKLAGTVSKHQT